jgi:hypothetical protein
MTEKIYPRYGEASLAEIPGTVLELLGEETELEAFSPEVLDTEESYGNVVLILIDGLRYDAAEQAGGFFEHVREAGGIEEITSVFPSATSATLTTLNTGSRPLGHGLLGWEMYYREIDRTIFTLPFNTLDGEDPEEEGLDPEDLFEGMPFYPDMDAKSFSIVKRDLQDSIYTGLTSEGSEKVPYSNTADMALKLRKVLEEEESRKYVYGYTADVDSASHHEGPESEAVENQVEIISDALNRNLVEGLDKEDVEDTLLWITSDHGQIEGGERVDLLQWDKVHECMERNSMGELKGPCGNAGRSVFLHVKDERVEELKDFLDEKIDAEVLETKEAIEQGLFGPGKEAERFRERAGELTIISNGRKIHWFRPEEIEDVGFHGGLHPDEMRVPLLHCELSDLQ